MQAAMSGKACEPPTATSPTAISAWPSTMLGSTPQRSAIQPAGRDMSDGPM